MTITIKSWFDILISNEQQNNTVQAVKYNGWVGEYRVCPCPLTHDTHANS